MHSKQGNTTFIFAPKTYQYEKSSLDLSSMSNDPIVEFSKWFEDAKNDPTEDIPEALNLATAELPSGRVSNRILLLKELDTRGFVIYSNWGTSKKAHDIETNPYAAISFFWKNLQRQVRVEGITELVSREISARYFKTRERGSKISAWASTQSQRIESREELEKMVQENEFKFKDVEDVPCPDYWGGIRIVPLEIEFWQGRPSRLHDRIVYKRNSESEPWEVFRRAP